MEPPPCIQNAMLTKDKKPFTYTPGGLNLSEIRSPRMARRIERNAAYEGVGTPQPQPSNRPQFDAASLPPSTLAAMQPQMHVQVFPSGPPPPPPMNHMRVGAPPPPSCGAAPPPPPLPTQKFRTADQQVVERPDMTKIIPDNPMTLLKKTGGPRIKNTLLEEAYQNQQQQQPQTPPTSQVYQVRSPPAQMSTQNPQQWSPKIVERAEPPELDQQKPANVGTIYIQPLNKNERNRSPPTPQSPKVQSPGTPTLKEAPRPWQQKKNQQEDVPEWAKKDTSTSSSPIVQEIQQTPVDQAQRPRWPQNNQQTPKVEQNPQFYEQPQQPFRVQQQQPYREPQQQQPYREPQQQRVQQQQSFREPQPQPYKVQQQQSFREQQPYREPQQQPYREPQQQTYREPQRTPQQEPYGVQQQHVYSDQQPDYENHTNAVYVTQPIILQHPGSGYGPPLINRRENVTVSKQQGNSTIIPVQFEEQPQNRNNQQNWGNSFKKTQPNDSDQELLNRFKQEAYFDKENPRYRGSYIPSKVFRILELSDVGSENFPYGKSTDPRYKGAAIPSKAFRLLKHMTEASEVTRNVPNDPGYNRPQVRNIPIQIEGGGAPSPVPTYVPPSQQTPAEEPKKYTGSSIPSRSFRILQAMTAHDSCANAKDANEHHDPSYRQQGPELVYPHPYFYPPYWPPFYPPPRERYSPAFTPHEPKSEVKSDAPPYYYWPSLYPPYANCDSDAELKQKTTPETSRCSSASELENIDWRKTPVPFWNYPQNPDDSCNYPQFYMPYYYGYPPFYSPFPYDDVNGYSSTDEMSYYAQKSTNNPKIATPEIIVTPTPPEIDATKEITSDSDDTDTEIDNETKLCAPSGGLQTIKSVTNIQIYRESESDNDDVDEEDSDDESSTTSLDEDNIVPHQLSVIFEVSERTEISRNQRENSVASECSTMIDEENDEKNFWNSENLEEIASRIQGQIDARIGLDGRNRDIGDEVEAFDFPNYRFRFEAKDSERGKSDKEGENEGKLKEEWRFKNARSEELEREMKDGTTREDTVDKQQNQPSFKKITEQEERRSEGQGKFEDDGPNLNKTQGEQKVGEQSYKETTREAIVKQLKEIVEKHQREFNLKENTREEYEIFEKDAKPKNNDEDKMERITIQDGQSCEETIKEEIVEEHTQEFCSGKIIIQEDETLEQQREFSFKETREEIARKLEEIVEKRRGFSSKKISKEHTERPEEKKTTMRERCCERLEHEDKLEDSSMNETTTQGLKNSSCEQTTIEKCAEAIEETATNLENNSTTQGQNNEKTVNDLEANSKESSDSEDWWGVIGRQEDDFPPRKPIVRQEEVEIEVPINQYCVQSDEIKDAINDKTEEEKEEMFKVPSIKDRIKALQEDILSKKIKLGQDKLMKDCRSQTIKETKEPFSTHSTNSSASSRKVSNADSAPEQESSSEDSNSSDEEQEEEEKHDINNNDNEDKPATIKQRIEALHKTVEAKGKMYKDDELKIRNTSAKSSVKSFDEISEEDSGVTDMSRHYSDHEEFPELRKMSKYQRAATHSRLFQLLQEECENDDDEFVITDRKNQLTLPLMSDKLADELVTSVLRQKRGQIFRNMSMEKLHAAARKILQEDTPSEGFSSQFCSPLTENSENEYARYYESFSQNGQLKFSARCPMESDESCPFPAKS